MRSLIFGGFDFGYTWPWTCGHLAFALLCVAAAAVAWLRFRARRTAVALVVGVIWALAGFLVVHYGFRINAPVALPTAQFLPQGAGRVLDMGSGSGRATLMVLLERPRARVVALDNWSARYIADNRPRRLLANAAVAGAADRVEAVTGDMRSLPFDDGSFDGIVSTYAIDHLNRDGITKALAEASRVLKPGGSFLLMVIRVDAWMAFVNPLFGLHGLAGLHGGGGSDVDQAWTSRLATAGFELVERGHAPGTAYFLVRKPGESARQ
jgi:SAM-dependent methyltransferase